MARNIVWNLSGLMAPAVAAIVAIPLLIESIGNERFGILAIIWMGVGYFSFFDMGFGRALTKLVAERLGTGDDGDFSALIWTALSVIFGIGLLGAGLVWLSSAAFVNTILNVAPSIRNEAIEAFRVLAFGLPFVVVTSALIGILEAHQRFATITAIRVPLGLLTFAGPLATALVTPSLVWATSALLVARAFAFLAYFRTAASVRPELKRPEGFDREHFGVLARYGGWLTITNAIGPLMIYFDRFFVGAIMNMTAVAYYVTPYEVLSRMRLLPHAMVGVLFPVLAASAATQRRRLVTIYGEAQRVLFLVMLPIFSAFFLLGPEIMQTWLGDEFSNAATPVLRWLSVGWLINALARLPFTLLQSAGYPDLVAKTHLVELVPYAIALWFLTEHFGIAGTAAAWFLRVLADTVALNLLAARQFQELRRAASSALLGVALVVTGFALLSQVESFGFRAGIILVVGLGSAVKVWPIWRLLITKERATPEVHGPNAL